MWNSGINIIWTANLTFSVYDPQSYQGYLSSRKKGLKNSGPNWTQTLMPALQRTGFVSPSQPWIFEQAFLANT